MLNDALFNIIKINAYCKNDTKINYIQLSPSKMCILNRYKKIENLRNIAENNFKTIFQDTSR